MYAETYLEPSPTYTVECLCKKTHKNFAIDVRLSIKYASGIGFTVENVYRMSILFDIVKVDSEICHYLLVSQVN